MTVPSAPRTQRTTNRPAMTPEQARSFERFSVTSAMMVALQKRDCGCSAYEDVFTFNRWKAQGMSVKRGEKSITLPMVRMVETEDEDTGEEKSRRLLTTSHVFCRCQVEKSREYSPADVFRFKGKSEVKRLNAPAFPCGCKPYHDVLTAGRWRALGFYVRQGESAMHRAGRLANTPLFCRCQVEPLGGDAEPVETWEPGDPIPGFEGQEPEPRRETGEFTFAGWINDPERVGETADVRTTGDMSPVVRVPVLRLQLVRDSGIASEAKAITGPADVVTLLRSYLGDPDREHVVAVLVDTKHRVNGIHTVAIGTLNSCTVEAREVFKAAILANAAAIILGHNHPSGDPTPSPDDVAITKKLREVGELVGIELLDHVVLGQPSDLSTGWVSLRERGLGF